MSTYLVAFVVSDFASRQSQSEGNGVEFSIWSRKPAFNQTIYADSIGAKVLKYFEDYFKVSFPLPKQVLRIIAFSIEQVN